MKGGLVTPSKSLPAHPSFESLRKQAKKLAHTCAAGESDAVTRVHTQLPNTNLPLSLRDPQLFLTREYGFSRCHDLSALGLRLEAKSLDSAVAGAERTLNHDN